MSKGNGSTKTPLGVLEEVSARLAAITPEQFVAPDIAREKDAHFVCMATDSIKRLFTLGTILGKEEDALKKEMIMQTRKTQVYIAMKNPEALHVEFQTPDSLLQAMLAGLKQAQSAFVLHHKLTDLIEKMFWFEVRRQHTDLAVNPLIGIYNDWSLCWLEHADSSVQILVDSMLVEVLGEVDRQHMH